MPWPIGLLACLLFLSAEAVIGGEPPTRFRPNVVYILADDLGYGDLSCYGATKIKTPNIDRLATQGVKFTDAQASASVCQPSRYGILTGRYYWRAKKTGDGYYFQDNEILMPEVMRKAGTEMLTAALTAPPATDGDAI